MKIDIDDIKEKYIRYIFKIISARFWTLQDDFLGMNQVITNNPEVDNKQIHLQVYEQVLNDLKNIKVIRAVNGEYSLLNLIKKITNARCIDYIRKVRATRRKGRRIEQYCESSLPGGFWHRKPSRTKNQLPNREKCLEKLRGIGLKKKYMDILMARGEGFSREEMARTLRLTEQQVKGRLEYARRKAWKAINSIN